MSDSEVVVAYIPVLHEGYRRFLDAHGAGRRLFLIGPELYADYRPLAKDIRCLPRGAGGRRDRRVGGGLAGERARRAGRDAAGGGGADDHAAG